MSTFRAGWAAQQNDLRERWWYDLPLARHGRRSLPAWLVTSYAALNSRQSWGHFPFSGHGTQGRHRPPLDFGQIICCR